MQLRRWFIGVAAAACCVAASPRALVAQGVTTAAISGTVTDDGGQPIDGAQVQVLNRATGFSIGGTSNAAGRYSIQGLEVGGPYVVTIRRIGFQQQSSEDLSLRLGQNLRLDFTLPRQTTVLTGVTVTAVEDPIFSPARTGVSTTVSDTALRRLPSLNRNFTDFVALSPQISSAGPGLSGGGVNNRYNSIQIDGTNATDLFGLGSTGQPGGQAGGKSISIEAVKEYQVLLTPFDVRQGNFAGALVNAVTRSGTNDWRATGFYYLRNNDLARDVDFLSEYDNRQMGFSLGGPIRRDQMHFFVASEWQQETSPASGPYLGQPAGTTPAVPVSTAEIERFQSIMRGYGLEPGDATLVNNQNPLDNVFGRIDMALPWNTRLALRHNYAFSQRDVFGRSSSSEFALSGAGYFFQSTNNSTSAEFRTNFEGGSYNEFQLTRATTRDRRTPNVTAPRVNVGTGGHALVGGSEQFSMGNELDQDQWEIKNDFSFSRGDHRFTVGTQNQFFQIRNLFNRDSWGVYWFTDLDAFEAGTPVGYSISKDLGGGVEVNMDAAQYAVYAQDVWQATPRLSLTLGMRVDVPVLSTTPAFTQRVQDAFGRRTDVVPSGNILWSPRVGFNWDMETAMRTQLRGGVGMFAGRPAYVWLSNAFQNSGSGLGLLMCGRNLFGSGNNNAPRPFNPNPDSSAQPGTCANGTGLSSFLGLVDLLSEDLRFPQTLRGTLGIDRELPGGFVGTLEGLYTRNVNDFFYVNRNLSGPTGQLDRHGRVMYGTVTPNAAGTGRTVTPAVVDAGFGDVIDVVNSSRNYSFNITGELQRRFGASFEARAAYTYSQVRDAQSLTSSQGISNWRFGASTAGVLEDMTPTRSLFEQPHKLVMNGTYTTPWRTDISLIYIGQTGGRFEYVYNGDVNADRATSNDLIYVPTSATDATEIQFRAATFAGTTYTAAQQAEAFEQYINDSPCLRAARGRILERNECLAPWRNLVNLSIRQRLPDVAGNALALQIDVFNFGNLLNRDWGQVRSQGSFSNITVLSAVGSTPGATQADRQHIFTFNPTLQEFSSNNIASQYQIQVAARYSLF